MSHRPSITLALALVLACALPCPADEPMQMPMPAEAPAPSPASMPMHPMAMHAALGPYAMSRAGSGTSWQPESTPMGGLHTMDGDWMFMAHGLANAVDDRQSGPRGADATFGTSMLMLMAQHSAGPGTFGAETMLSLDPAMGPGGYPLLLQTGETADGRTPLVDHQHPHDAFMELAGSYSLPVGEHGAVFGYAGLPGEPALGPTAFMHRFSGMRIPEAPLSHHWLDATHVTFGVATLGASDGPWKLEGSWFNGREPDQHRWNIETRAFDSWSARLSWNPTRDWALQVSRGDLKHPEQLEPDTRVVRTTASASWQTRLAGGPWQTTLAWGRNDHHGPDDHASLPAWLLESTASPTAHHTVFLRLEQVDNDELVQAGQPLAGEAFEVRKLTVGGIYDFARTGPLAWGVGALVGAMQVPGALEPLYGHRPLSTMVFLQARM